MADYVADRAFNLKDRVKEKVMGKTGSKLHHSFRLISIFLVPEWGFVFVGIIAMLIVLGCAYTLIRKLFGKKRHGEKNKSKGGLKGFFKGGKDAAGPDFTNIGKDLKDLDALQENVSQYNCNSSMTVCRWNKMRKSKRKRKKVSTYIVILLIQPFQS